MIGLIFLVINRLPIRFKNKFHSFQINYNKICQNQPTLLFCERVDNIIFNYFSYVFQYKVGVSFTNMKKSKSPSNDKSKSDLTLSIKGHIQKQLQRPYRPIVHLFTKNHFEQQKRNANSIKKVLRQLTDLKKELRDVKNSNKINSTSSQGLDMSICRKKKGDVRKSPQSANKITSKSRSSSRYKSNSNTKQISTQTKQKHNEVNQFSFSVDSKAGKKHSQLLNHSEQEQDSEQYDYPNKKRSQVQTKRRIDRRFTPQKINITQTIVGKVATIQASQLYQRYIKTLRANIDTIQISSALLGTEDKLKLNLQMERINKNVCRIPIYTNKQQQYYQTMQLYARSLNNQLNNFLLILNRCQEKYSKLRQINLNQGPKDNLLQKCRSCEQNEKKGLQKGYKRQIKKLQKHISKLQLVIQQKNQGNNELRTVNKSLLGEIDNKQRLINDFKNREQQSKKNENLLKQQIIYLQEVTRELQNNKGKQLNKLRLMEEDIKYYKLQVDKLKSNVYDNRSHQKQDRSNIIYVQARNRELQTLVRQLKQKQKLYQTIIRQKEAMIDKINIKPTETEKNPKGLLKYHSEDDSIDSAQYYRKKVQLQEKQKQCEVQTIEIKQLKQDKVQLQMQKRQLSNNLEMCLAQINKLHSQVDNLEEANQKYKDKALKSRVINQRKTKREVEAQNKKGQALQQINDLIKVHRQVLGKQKR